MVGLASGSRWLLLMRGNLIEPSVVSLMAYLRLWEGCRDRSFEPGGGDTISRACSAPGCCRKALTADPEWSDPMVKAVGFNRPEGHHAQFSIKGSDT